MSLGELADRCGAAFFMLIAASLMALPRPGRRARTAWVALILATSVYALALNATPANLPNTNFDHYWLGAKYPLPYLETYRVVRAGQGLPQLGFRDLAHPGELVSMTPEQQRAYYLDLLRARHVSFDPLAPLDSLARLARDSGAVEAEARTILAKRLPAARIEGFRADVRAMSAVGQGARLTVDYGYNGSPFYGLMRQLDPAVHLRFSRSLALAGLVEQWIGVVVIAWLSGPALGLTSMERLAFTALLLASQEFSQFLMSGLVFIELWIPLLLALWAIRAGRPALAGAAIAFAGLVKLFPFTLLLLAIVPLTRTWVTKQAGAARSSAPRAAWVMLGACAFATLVLAGLAQASGRDWSDFTRKIVVEFQSGLNLINSVSAAAALTTIGVPERSPVVPLVSLAALAALGSLLWNARVLEDRELTARRALLLLCGVGWLVKTWFNYYAVAPFLALPIMARRHRLASVSMVVLLALGSLLPRFDSPELITDRALHLLRLLPYLAVPAGLVALELAASIKAALVSRTLWIVGLSLAVLIAVEAWRGGVIGRLQSEASAALDDSDWATVLERTKSLARLGGMEAGNERQRAIALASVGRMDEALRGFDRAVAQAPSDAAAHDDYGRALLMSGHTGAALVQLERAQSLAPADAQILFALAKAREKQGDHPGVLKSLDRALELAPGDSQIAEALRRARNGAESW